MARINKYEFEIVIRKRVSLSFWRDFTCVLQPSQQNWSVLCLIISYKIIHSFSHEQIKIYTIRTKAARRRSVKIRQMTQIKIILKGKSRRHTPHFFLSLDQPAAAVMASGCNTLATTSTPRSHPPITRQLEPCVAISLQQILEGIIGYLLRKYEERAKDPLRFEQPPPKP